MNQTTIINKLNDLKYHGFKTAYLRQLEDTNYSKLSFDERIYNLLEAQEIYLDNNRISINLRLSKIKDKQASLEDIEYSVKRKIDKSVISQALGNRAIIDGFRVYYIRVPTLLEEIKVSRATGTYTNLLKKYSRFQLLILDDFGTSTISTDDATNLFEIIEDRTEINSTIITSQLPVSNWYDYLNNDTVADAILDRIIHSSHRIELEGESMRKLRSKINKN